MKHFVNLDEMLDRLWSSHFTDTMSSGVLEDEADPNYTHFAHRDELLALLGRFLKTPPSGQEERSNDLVKAMGSIVRRRLDIPVHR